MRRLIALALALACVSAVPARAGNVSLGAYGGMVYPVLQTDVGNGTLYGVRMPVNVVPLLSVEPYWASSKLGNKVQSVAGLSYTFAGFDETVYGANLLLATGGPVSFYPVAGAGKATLKRGGVSQSYTTYNLGAGLSISAVPKISLNIRGEAQAVVSGKTTRKFGNVTAGVSYALFGMP